MYEKDFDMNAMMLKIQKQRLDYRQTNYQA